MDHEFSGDIWYWRGPSPFHFVTVPEPESREINELAGEVSYGWGMIPVLVRIGDTEWATSLWPKDGGYIVPLKLAVQRAEQVTVGDTVAVGLTIAPRSPRPI